MKKSFSLAAALCALFFSTLISGASTDTIEAYKTDTPPILDGKLDDPVWQKTRGYTGMKSFLPEWGREAKQKTVAFTAYDKDFLYLGFRCYDTEPEKVVTTVYKRDGSSRDDKVAVFIDSHNDGQNAYFLVCNSLGIQSDGVVDSEAINDRSQDFVWESAGVRDDKGFTVEMKIPFQTLRFKNRDVVTMRIAFWRRASRHNEYYVYPEWKTGVGSMLSQFASVNFKGIKYKRVFDVLPSVTFMRRRSRDENNQLKPVAGENFHMGLTSKIGITSDLTLDVAVNPDFSHIESDEGQVDVNLRAGLFVNEKRPFFLEGLEHFDFAAIGDYSSIEKVVHTRNIIDPSIGIKLSGKTSKRGVVNSLFAVDEAADQKNYFGILRYKHLLKSDSYIGGIYTSKEYNGGHLRIAGLDARYRLSGSLILDSYLLLSMDQPDRQSNQAEGAAYGGMLRYESNNYLSYLAYHDVGTAFNLDPGRYYRLGYRTFNAGVSRYFYFKSDFLKRLEVAYNGRVGRDNFFGMNDYSHGLAVSFLFPSTSMVSLDYTLATEVVEGTVYDINRFSFYIQSQPIPQLYLKFSYDLGSSPHYLKFLHGDLKRLIMSVNFQPWEKFSTEFSYKHHVFHEKSSGDTIYNIGIYRNKTVYQLNKHLSLRSVFEYDTRGKRLLCDGLVEFTLIPGTVIHLGYSPTLEREYYDGEQLVQLNQFRTVSSTFFFKASYLFRF